MRILAVSDRVEEKLQQPNVRQTLGAVELILACGDLPPHYLELLTARLDAPLLYVLGNHDQGVFTADGSFKEGPAGCVNMDGRVVEISGLLVGGLEGSMLYSQGEHQYSEWDMFLKALRLAPALWANRLRRGRFLDILITHAPPYCIHDGEDLCHTGFKTFRWLMDTYRPRYLIHGHQHVYDDETVIRTTHRQTQVLNAYGYQVLDWEQEGAP